MNFPIEEFKKMLDTGRNYISTGSIIGLFITEDNSDLIAQVSIFDDGEDRVVEARVTWQACSMGSGIFQLPALGDGVVVAYPEGEDAEALIIARMTNEEDKIPDDASDGHLVLKSLKSKDLNLRGGKNINLVGQDTETGDALQKAVLGGVLKTYLETLVGQVESIKTEAAKIAGTLKKETNVGNGAPLKGVTDYGTIETDIAGITVDPPTDDILSDLVRLEKGGDGDGADST